VYEVVREEGRGQRAEGGEKLKKHYADLAA